MAKRAVLSKTQTTNRPPQKITLSPKTEQAAAPEMDAASIVARVSQMSLEEARNTVHPATVAGLHDLSGVPPEEQTERIVVMNELQNATPRIRSFLIQKTSERLKRTLRTI